jgi:hypothetical protein
VDKYFFDTTKYKDVPRGEYLTKFKAYLPTDEKCIIYGMDLTCKVADKA